MNFKYFKTYVSYLMLVIMTAIVLFITLNFYSDNKTFYIKLWIFITFVFYVFIMINNKITDKRFLCASNIFISIAIIFWNGQAFLYLLGVQSKYYVQYLTFTNKEKLISQIYTCLFLIFFHLGKMIYFKLVEKKHNKKTEKINLVEYKKAMYITGLIMIIASMYPYYSTCITDIIESMRSGYSSIYIIKQRTGIQNIFLFMNSFFIPGIILLYVSECVKYKKIFNIFAAISVMLPIISGGRGGAISTVLAFVFIIFNKGNTKNTKKYVLLIALAVIIVITMPLIAVVRVENHVNLVQAFKQFLQNNNPLYSFVGEMGYSQVPLVYTMDLIPKFYPYHFGLSYIASFVAIIPSLLMFGFSMTTQAGLSVWLMGAMHMTFGPGYSLIAETYYNFGNIGFLFAVVIGMFFAKFLFYKKENEYDRTIKIAYVAIFLSVSIISSRAAVYLLIRDVIYLIVIPKLVIGFIYRSNMKKRGI